MQQNKILITGADGFIGSHLTETLCRKGYPVKAFVLYNSFNSWGWLDSSEKKILDNIEIFPGDIRDPFCVKKAVEDCNIIIHLAALIAIPYSYKAPSSYIDTNITGTLNILQAGKACDVDKIIHTSTSEVYGTAQFVPITEEHPLQGQSPYSATKIAADQMALSFYRSFETPICIIRPFNTFGPRQSARAVIPTIISQIAAGDRNIVLGALTPTRDFSYIEDTVSGFISAVESDKINGEVLNLGTGFEISIQELVKLIAEVMEVNITVCNDPERIRPEKSEVNRLCSDNSKIERLTGWKPKFHSRSGLKKGIKKTVDWFSDKKNLALYKTNIYNL